ncbi:MAG: hypothetical protein J6M95_00920 [Bacilli bacterium]|nr:hypothetical protein [Bacilli bacterium]
MRKHKFLPLMLLLTFSIFSCGLNPQNVPTEKTYEKDEDGFYILEEDYFSYKEDSSDTRNKSAVYIPKLQSTITQNSQMRLFVGDKQVPIYNVLANNSHSWTPNNYSRINCGYASIGLKGRVTLKLQTSFKIFEDAKVTPLSRGVKQTIDNERRVLTFEINQTGQYVVEFRGGRTLHLFVEDIDIMSENTQGTMYFAPGVHNKGTVYLNSNASVYLAPGSFVYGKFIANNASNITISGAGYIDGSKYDRDASKGTVTVPIEFNNCSNITLKDFSCIDPAGWTFNMYFCNEVNIDNVKIISSRSNGDGISIQSCQNVNVTNSFIRSWDDSLVVKNYPQWSNRNIEGTTRSIHFNNCILWTGLAQSMEVGYETVGQIMDDISFENITVLHNFHKAVFSIHNGNNANITNVRFENITVEGANMGRGDGSRYLVDIQNLHSSTWSDQHKITGLGSIDEVTLKNIKVLSGIKNPAILLEGCLENRDGFPHEAHTISNVKFIDFYLYDKVIDSTYENYITNEYVSNVSFSTTGKEITGAILDYKDVSDYGNNLIFK